MRRAVSACLIAARLTAPVLAGAQDATPVHLPTVSAATDCTVPPVTLAEVEAALAAACPPVPEVDVAGEDELPTGEPADLETVAGITAGEYAFAACYNAGDWPRIMGLLADRALASFAGEDAATLFATSGTPETDAGETLTIVLIAVRNVRVLPDGRVGAVVEWGREGDSPPRRAPTRP